MAPFHSQLRAALALSNLDRGVAMRIFLVLIMLVLVTANVSLSQAHAFSHDSCISLCPTECEFESCDLIIENQIQIVRSEEHYPIYSYVARPSSPAIWSPKRPPKINA